MVKKHFNEEHIMTKEENEEFKNSTKYWICDNDYIDNDVKLRDLCRSTGKYRGSAQRNCDINFKINHKIHLKSYDFQLIMQELGKLNLKVSVKANGLEKYMSFTINNKSSVIDSMQF